jgi:hypothetical protein
MRRSRGVIIAARNSQHRQEIATHGWSLSLGVVFAKTKIAFATVLMVAARLDRVGRQRPARGSFRAQVVKTDVAVMVD